MNPSDDQYLDLAAISVRDMRAACITLAGLALHAAGGDREQAAAMLVPALEAVGAVPYGRAPGKYRFGAAS